MDCWLVGFQQWWEESGEEFPVRPNKDFHAQAWWYANNKKTGPYETTRCLADLLVFWFHLSHLVSMAPRPSERREIETRAMRVR